MRRIAALLALLVTGCISPQQRSATELADVEKNLRLSIRPLSSTAGLEFSVQNISTVPMIACLSDGRAVNLVRKDPFYVRLILAVFVDHPRCTTRIALQPQESFHWNEQVHIPDVPPGGPVSVRASVPERGVRTT